MEVDVDVDVVEVVTVEKVVGMVVTVVDAPGTNIVIGMLSFGVTMTCVPNAAMYVWFSWGEQSAGLPLGHTVTCNVILPSATEPMGVLGNVTLHIILPPGAI